ncbi:MAG: biotin/lipoyl-binding protein [Candidatus Cloacimonetes bacterium]|jgi:biotin carboxyl carrier protein|nr:biotin/lipoyl-binding protein [Candidatus Cloacimonadota bacterium]
MRYYVTIGERTFEVTLDDEGMAVDGARVQADLRPVPGTPMHHLLLDGQSYLLHAASGRAGEWVLHANGARYDTEVVDERTRAIRALTSSAAGPRGPKPVRAPMPGLVVRLLVEPGQRVEAGQGVAIVEAMKMENELKADAAGVVARVAVAAGQAVEKGAIMIEFEVEAA